MKRVALLLIAVSIIPALAVSPEERAIKSCWNSPAGCSVWVYDLQSFFPKFGDWLQFTADLEAIYAKHKLEMPRTRTSPFQYMSHFPTPQKWLDFVYDLVNCYARYHIPVEQI